jgi:hypothetical protein
MKDVVMATRGSHDFDGHVGDEHECGVSRVKD